MKAIVCGAGIAGLTLAGELGTAGWEVVVLEQSPAPRGQGYMIDFFGPGYDAAEAMGLLPRLKELAYPVEKVDFITPRGRRLSLDYGLIARSQHGKIMSLLRPDLELALFERLPETVDLRFGCRVVSIENGPDVATAVLDDGTIETADLLFGADGIHSVVRAELFGPEEQYLRYLGAHTFAYTFEDSAFHDKIGDTWGLTDELDRTAGLYAIRDGRIAMFGAHGEPDPAIPKDRRAAVLESYRTSGWLIPEALAHCPDDAELYYDQVAQIELPTWHRGRIALVGDASGAVSLLAGQGASLAVVGARLLAREVLSGKPVEEALLSYERVWQPVVAEKQLAGRRAAGSFIPKSQWMLLVRRAGLWLMQVPGIGRLVGSRIAGKESSALR